MSAKQVIELDVVQADALAFNGAALLVVGNFKSGKTVLAATASKDAPAKLDPKNKTLLSDILFLQFEPGGIRSATSLGLVPKHVIDFAAPKYRIAQDPAAEADKSKTSNELLLDWTKIRPALLASAKYVESNPEIKIVVVDNLSRYCEMLEYHFQQTCKKNGATDTFEVYSQIKKANIWLANLFINQRVLLIALSHVKSAAAQDEAKLQAKSVGGDLTTLVPAIPAGSAGFWSGFADAVLCTMRIKKKVGTEEKYEYRTLMTSSSKLPSGNRFGLEGSIESHLGPILNKYYSELHR